MNYQRIVWIVVGILAALGFQFYSKSAKAKEVKQEMIAICASNSDCQSAIDNYFKTCFDSSYRAGSRRRASSLDKRKLSRCINNKSKTNFFAG